MNSKAQKSTLKKFLKLHLPEKIWVLSHPFVAGKANIISENAYKIAEEKLSDPDLDGDGSGGQVDAFRHALWMAMLTQEIGAWRARRLGIAHEKSNETDFKNKTLEEGFLPNFVSCQMDLQNNELGIDIAKKNKTCTQTELIEIVKKKVIEGQAVKIKKNKNREFLDSQGKIIPKQNYLGKWYSPKTLVRSDFQSDN